MAENNAIQQGLEEILARYVKARREDDFGKSHDLWRVFQSLEQAFSESDPLQKRDTLQVQWSVGQGNWARIPWIAFLDSRETDTTQRGTYCVFLFRQDMTGVYLTYNQGVTALNKEHGRRKAREILQSRARELRTRCSSLAQVGFSLDDGIDLRTDSTLGRDYEHSTIAYRLYRAGAVPADEQVLTDVEAVVRAYDADLAARDSGTEPVVAGVAEGQADSWDKPGSALEPVRRFVAERGFVFQPWQIAAYVAALQTKPFVILAGVSGTGKTKLPQLVADATGAKCEVVPVRPNWTDSADVLGYEDLRGNLRVGPLLRMARTADEDPKTHYVCVIDEMNLARVEYYFAEVLSRMEDRTTTGKGGYRTRPLLNLDLTEADQEWAEQGLPPNLAIVGTVNMDETTHSFSRKVLDRAFTLEFSGIDLTQWDSSLGEDPSEPEPWPVEAWLPRAVQLSELSELSDTERSDVDEVVETLSILNEFLVQAQLQVGYRTRDEAALFVLHAREFRSAFVTRDGDEVSPLDLVLHMKVLPRIVGGSNAVRRLLLQLLGWAEGGKPFDDQQQATALLERWRDQERSTALPDADYPQTAGRLCLMWDRLQSEGFTSFWL